MSPPDITVVVPVFNKARELRMCLDLLKEQSLPPDRWEVVVVDDGSTDESASIASSGCEGLVVTTVRLYGRSRGAARARNLGARTARGRILVFLRIADDWEDKKIVRPTLARRIKVRVTRLENLIREMAANWESLRPEENRRVDPAERARFLGAWNEHRQIYGYTLLAELPNALRNALNDHPDLEGVNYDLLIVDEYQDLNVCDLEVLRLIGGRGCSIMAAGDDDQSIYSFRRAAPEGIRRFLHDYPGAGDYSLSVTQRCGRRIMEWATYVVEGDPDRPGDRPRLRTAEGSPPGEVGLLAFAGEISEAAGITRIIQGLIDVEHIPASEILVLLRGDHNGVFSRPIKERLVELSIPFSDPGIVERMLSEAGNRRMLAVLRLLVNRHDSLAWASLVQLTNGIGDTFLDYVHSVPAHIEFNSVGRCSTPMGKVLRADQQYHQVAQGF